MCPADIPCSQHRSVVTSPNPSPTDNFLGGVAAVSTNDVWAVGWYENNSLQRQQILIEHWNGTKWNVVTSPTRNVSYMALAGLAVVSANDIWGVGSYLTATQSQEKTLIEHWNGTAWSVISAPGQSRSALTGIAVLSATDIWAVGGHGYFDQPGQTLIEHWNGTVWRIVPSPNPGSTDNGLGGVARVPGTRTLWAVGSYSSDPNFSICKALTLYYS